LDSLITGLKRKGGTARSNHVGVATSRQAGLIALRRAGVHVRPKALEEADRDALDAAIAESLKFAETRANARAAGMSELQKRVAGAIAAGFHVSVTVIRAADEDAFRQAVRRSLNTSLPVPKHPASPPLLLNALALPTPPATAMQGNRFAEVSHTLVELALRIARGMGNLDHSLVAQPPAVTVPDPAGYLPSPPLTPLSWQSGMRRSDLADPGRPHSDPPPGAAAPSGLTPRVQRLYDKLNLKVTPETLPAYTDDDLIGEPKKLGSGAFNTVYSVQLRNHDGTEFNGVFKPLQSTDWTPKGRPTVALKTGIPANNPQTAMRNIATGLFDKALGFGVTPPVCVGLLKDRLGLIMGRAPGRPAADTDYQTMANPEVIRKVTEMQLLDHLTGQGDRHRSNYFVDVAPDGDVTVTGIDNDLCFGAKLTDPAGIRHKGKEDAFNGTDLPPVVDEDMASAINKLSHEDIKAMLQDKLSEAEVNAAILRLDGVKAHIAELAEDGRVVKRSQWNDARVLQHLTPQNSYAARDFHLARNGQLSL
jgi:hypothetical protein